MTISSTTRKAGPFPGNGVTVALPFTFKVFTAADVLAVQAVTATGVETTLALGTDYTVSLNADQDTTPGGTLTLVTAHATGTTVTLTTQIENTQGTDLTNLGGFYPKVINDALDRATIQIQQLAEKLSRVLTFGISSGASGTLPNPSPLSVLGWNAAGTALQNFAGGASAAVSSFMATVVAAVDAVAAQTALGATTVGRALFGAADAAAARTAIGAQVAGSYATSGANTNITSLSGSNALLINSATTSKPAVRQTVLSGPVDTNGFAAFGGSTGSTTVTASGTLVATAANGYAMGGGVDYTGTITNPSWTGLSTNGTMYLYLDIAANGTCTTGSTTLAPTYRWGGADVTTNNQATFNIQEMQMKVGNGATAVQTFRVFVGQVTVAGAVVTAITWYALQGRYDSGYTSTLPGVGTAVSRNANLGVDLGVATKLELQCLTAEAGYGAGDVVTEITVGSTSGTGSAQVTRTRNTVGFTSGSSSAFFLQNKTTGASVALTAANWAYKLTAYRGW